MADIRPWRPMALIACGQAASMAVMAAAGALRLPLDRPALQWGAGALLAGALAWRCHRGQAQAGRAGMALWGFFMSTVHGSGLALLPSLMQVCGAGAAGALLQALAAAGLHLGAMLAANGAVFYLAARLKRLIKAG